MKYMGSKARIAKQILPIILSNRQPEQWYVEPFSGGMNSVCQVDGNRLANDNHYYLMQMWMRLMEGWQPPPKISREEYRKIKANQLSYKPELVGWVGFNCSYSGKWFGGYAGETQTLIGTVRDYQAEAIKNVLKQVKMLEGCRMENFNYFDLVIPLESIVYCDPPYAGTTGYGSTIDYDVFWQWAANLRAFGHSVFVSEYSIPACYAAEWECVWEQSVKSSLSANGRCGGSKQSVERLFTLKT